MPALSAQKGLQGSETEKRVLLEERKRMIASPQPPIPSMMDYLSPQFTNGNTQNEARMNRKLDRNSPAEMSFRPVTSTPSRNSPKEVSSSQCMYLFYNLS